MLYINKKLPANGWIISLNECDKLKVIQIDVDKVKRGCRSRIGGVGVGG